MLVKRFKKLIEPSSKEPDQAAREIVLNYLLVGVLSLSIVALADTAGVYVVTRHAFLVGRIVSNGLTILLLFGLYRAARNPRYHTIVAFVLLLSIAAAGTLVAYQWGIFDPNGLLLFSLAIVMAGILINARYSLYTAMYTTIALLGLEYTQTHGYTHPQLNWLTTKPILSDIVGFAAIILIIASVSWLFNHQMELALQRARRSERALKQQKNLLELKVKQRTEQLEAAQLEQLQELYRFAELGRLSTALFHDLANNLATVSVDIEGLKQRHESDIMQRIQHNIQHVDGVVRRVREQIQGKPAIEIFNVVDEAEEVVRLLSFSANTARVSVVLDVGQLRGALLYKGEVLRFRQILLNTISNGIEAYENQPAAKDQTRTVTVTLKRANRQLLITIADHGVGVPADRLTKIFEPFYSTKAKGVGIGLFIVKQVVEHDFQGTIKLTSSPEGGTVFSISLPKSYYAKTA